ncbi:hypothetical protein GCM10010964_34860 [Caldovatus sediminis]|uniref:DUF2786 domain-containing protein n=1 Tax=Caldovatus sediminis TaxID=2041189 RepID=A0A8J3EC94_9PROT|nr:DUF2786 domain-containing protein [Caldovatus sediminis]GGG44452.1 hypothetical protein GCM10010964_34860 [Caldovatus sediminis]
MDQQTELAKVKARIRALAARTVERGCSEAEAMAAAAKVGELLDVYGLTMSEVELREEACVQRSLVFADPRRAALKWLFPAVLRFTECRGWTVGRAEFALFGLEPDVQMAEYLMHVIAGALAYEERRFRESSEYAARRRPAQAVLRSFRFGFAARVADRLDAMAERREAAAEAARAATPAGTALVLLKEQRLSEGFRRLGIRLTTVHRRMTVQDRAAYGRGREAGGRVGLDRPVEGGGAMPALPRRRR